MKEPEATKLDILGAGKEHVPRGRGTLAPPSETILTHHIDVFLKQQKAHVDEPGELAEEQGRLHGIV